MALRWENPASTTHSLTPSPSNRPLIFWILTPCEKPVATGSAGRCELGVGRFTDPHPLTCYNITPSFCWLMFRLCALPSALSNPVLYVEENSAFYRGQSLALMRCLCRPSWACFFLFLLFPYLLSATSLPSRGEIVFLVPGLCRCPRIRPQLAHTAPTGPVWGSTGVVPLFGSQNRTQGRTRAFSLFPSTCSTFPLRGKVGLNSHPSCSARPNSSTTAPHGFNGAGNPSYWCRFPTRPTKPHTGPHRAEFGFHRLFLVRFGSGRVDKSFSSL